MTGSMSAECESSRMLLLCALSCVLQFTSLSASASAMNTMEDIKVGSRIPAFSLLDQNGKMVDISLLLGKKNLVCFFKNTQG